MGGSEKDVTDLLTNNCQKHIGQYQAVVYKCTTVLLANTSSFTVSF